MKEWTVDEIKKFMDTNDHVLYESIKRLYAQQTEAEKSSEQTKEHNGVGFNAVDAPFLSSLAKSLQRYGRLTDKQKAAGRKAMKKYAGQVTMLANYHEAAKVQA